MFGDLSTTFVGYSQFPTGKDCFSKIHQRYLTIFGAIALPLALLAVAGVFPQAPRLIVGWALFWLGIFRFWLRDVQLDDDALEAATEGCPLWCVPIVIVLAYATTILVLIMGAFLLGTGPWALMLVSVYSMLAAASLHWTVVRKSLHRRRKRMKALARVSHA
jgi:uncharacterized membrane protein